MLGLPIANYRLQINLCLLFSLFCFLSSGRGYAKEPQQVQPIIVNGDRVEYITESKEFTASGNVEVIYKGAKLTCEKLTLNTQTKDAQAEGHARLEEKGMVIEGAKLIYNFNNKTGTVIDADFRSNPYFGQAEKLDKVSEDEFVTRRSYITTCDFDHPHWRIRSRRMNFFPGDKVQTKDSVFYMGEAPLAYIPQYNHSLRDPLMHVQLMPGKSKEWGTYMQTAWRYNLTEDVTGRIYFDWREKTGFAEGLGANYKMADGGHGDFKYYFTHEMVRKNLIGDILGKYSRYLVRWRHKYDLDPQTNFIAEYHRIKDSKMALLGGDQNFLKDYFYREYEKESQPLSYLSLHHSFDYSSLDMLIQKRVNDWYDQDEKLPEIRFNLPSIELGNSPFYFEDNSSYMNYNHPNPVSTPPSVSHLFYNAYDTTNKLSMPVRVAFLNFNPFISGQATIYDKKDVYGSTNHLTFSLGSDLSTKFYRLFDVKTNFLGLDINGLRHIITPTASYSYTKTSVMPTGKFEFGGNSTTGAGAVALELENKLQTKRNNQKVDIALFKVDSTYDIKPKTGDKRGSNFSDFLFDLEVYPYSWLSFIVDATYKHSGNRSDAGYNCFTNANYDLDFNFGEERTIGIGQRYQLKGGNELTFSFNWRLNPKWKFSFYQRYNRGHDPTLKRGLREQEYTLSRDFHCWIGELTYNLKRGQGESIWLVFRLKAFPELAFEYNQSYHQPKPGSQSNP